MAEIIDVSDPIRVGDVVQMSNMYTITSVVASQDSGKEDEFPSNSLYSSRTNVVSRNYNDFEWIYNQLKADFPGRIIPPLPEKTVEPEIMHDQEFLLRRKRGLLLFLRQVAGHPQLQHSPSLQLFLKEQSTEFQSRRQTSGKDLQRQFSKLNSGLSIAKRSLWEKTKAKLAESEQVKHMAAKAGAQLSAIPKTEDDRQFDAALSYVEGLLNNLKELSSKLHSLQKQARISASTWEASGSIVERLCGSELLSGMKTADHLKSLSELCNLHKQTEDAKVHSLYLNIAEYTRQVQAVKDALKLREDKRLTYYGCMEKPNAEFLKSQFETCHTVVMEEYRRFLDSKDTALPSIMTDYIDTVVSGHQRQSHVLLQIKQRHGAQNQPSTGRDDWNLYNDPAKSVEVPGQPVADLPIFDTFAVPTPPIPSSNSAAPSSNFSTVPRYAGGTPPTSITSKSGYDDIGI